MSAGAHPPVDLVAGRSLAGTDATVVGAGVGGLSAASFLGAAGADVTVLERHDRPGGVAGRLDLEGYRFDTGPTWYLMPDVFERFFAAFGRSPEDYYDLERLDPHYRVFFKEDDADPTGDGFGTGGSVDRVDVPADPEGVRRLFESYEDGAGEAFEDYLAEAERTYRVGMERFVYRDRSRFRDLLDPGLVRCLPGLSFLSSMDEYVASYVDSPKLRQILQYSLVFLGGAPHNTPALYSLLAHVDFNLGVHYPAGGMASVVDALADLAREQGVEVRTGTEVTAIEPDPRGLAAVAGDDRRRADAVVANANPAHVERDLLSPRHRDRDPGYWDSRTYGPAAFLLYLGVEGDVDPLAHHTLVLPADWDPHFETIFGEPAWPDDPAYYVCVPSLTDDAVAPPGGHAVVVLVPVAPGLEDGPGVRERYREAVLADLAATTGVDLRDRIAVSETACVSEFAERFHNPRGTALGLAHTLSQTGPLRPSHRSSSLDGLYYAGGFTSPGIGVPMCLISGEHAVRAVAEDRSGGLDALPLA